MDSYVENVIQKRLEKRFPIKLFTKLSQANVKLFDIYVAGNSLNSGTPNDFDIFPTEKGQFNGVAAVIRQGEIKGAKLISNTKNALTVKYEGTVVQFCNYFHKSLESLVESFDFAHIKVGARVILVAPWNVLRPSVKDLYFSDDFIKAKLSGVTYFTGSEYPLSSLMRLFKYHKRGELPGRSYMACAIAICADIYERGFDNYEDFKDQMDAVDLGMAPEDIKELMESRNGDSLLRLFELLRRS